MGYIWNYLFDKNFAFFSDIESIFIYAASFLYSVLIAYFFTLIKVHIDKRQRLYKVFLIISYTMIALPVANVIGVRSSDVGYDTHNYILNYMKVANHGINFSEVFSQTTEFLYYILQKYSYYFFEGHPCGAIYPMTFFTVFFLSLGFDLWGLSKSLPFGLFLFYTYFGTNMSDQARQLLAMSIVVVAFYYFYHKKHLKFIVLVLFASTFHMTGMLALCLYPLQRINFKKKFNRFVFFITIFLLCYALYFKITDILLMLPVGSKYTYLVRMLVEKQPLGFRFFFDTLPFMLSFFLFRNKNDYEQWGIKRLCYFTLPFRMGAYRTYFIYRFMYYPAIFSIVTIANGLSDSNQRNLQLKRLCILFAFTVYFFADSFYFNIHGAVPYKVMP